MKIGDVISHHMASGCGFEFTISPPYSTNDDESPTRIHEGIYGCIAMNELIEAMSDSDLFAEDKPYYGWITIHGLIRS